MTGVSSSPGTAAAIVYRSGLSVNQNEKNNQEKTTNKMDTELEELTQLTYKNVTSIKKI